MHPLPPALQAGLLAVVLTAGISDILTRRIPNWIVLAGLLAGFAGNFALYRFVGLRTALLGMGLALLVYLPFHLLRGMGAGDVKLMAAVGAIAGPANWLAIFILTALMGAVFGLVLAWSRGAMAMTLSNLGFIARELVHFRAPSAGREELNVKNPNALRLPHGSVIALASVAFVTCYSFLVR